MNGYLCQCLNEAYFLLTHLTDRINFHMYKVLILINVIIKFLNILFWKTSNSLKSP